MNILIIGYGKLARSLAVILREVGDQVWGVQREQKDAVDDARMIYADAASEEAYASIKAAVPNPDYIVVTASPGLRGGGDNNLTNMAKLIIEHYPDAPLLYTSSTYVYASGNSVDEEAALLDDKRAQHLLAIESIFAKREHSLILRLSAIVGAKRNYIREAMRKATQSYAVSGPLNRRFNFIHEDDAAEVIVELIKLGSTGLFNLSSNHKITALDYYQGISTEEGLKLEIVEKDTKQASKSINCDKIYTLLSERSWRNYLDA